MSNHHRNNDRRNSTGRSGQPMTHSIGVAASHLDFVREFREAKEAKQKARDEAKQRAQKKSDRRQRDEAVRDLAMKMFLEQNGSRERCSGVNTVAGSIISNWAEARLGEGGKSIFDRKLKGASDLTFNQIQEKAETEKKIAEFFCNFYDENLEVSEKSAFSLGLKRARYFLGRAVHELYPPRNRETSIETS